MKKFHSYKLKVTDTSSFVDKQHKKIVRHTDMPNVENIF